MRNNNRKWIILSAVLLLTCAVKSSAQVQIELEPNSKTGGTKKSGNSRWEIPEATLPCSPEVKEWWNGLRDASDAVRLSRGDKKDRKRLSDLIAQGATKSFKPPIDDRKPFYLVQVEPQFTEDGRKHRVNGAIMLDVEFRADGTIGEVTPLNRLGFGLDESAITAARKAVFLPAVQNGEFVNFTTKVMMNFRIY